MAIDTEVNMTHSNARLGILLSALSLAPCAPAATVGDLLISEIMANPAAVSDSRGEWFELYNPSDEPVNLHGITLGDDGGDAHRIESDLLIMPRHFLVLARNGDATLNGGFAADYVYRDFTLGNTADEIVLRDGALEWLRFGYGAGFVAAGRSSELAGLPMTLANYALTPDSLAYGLGDIGTPGLAGSFSFTPAAVPLPAAAWLFAGGIVLLRRFAGRRCAGAAALQSVRAGA
jgi:hypothetical protein